LDPRRQDEKTHEVVININPKDGTIPDDDRLCFPDGSPIEMRFSHHIFDMELLRIRREVLPQAQGKDNLYFAAHWTNGVGVHECCWEAAVQVADLIHRDLAVHLVQDILCSLSFAESSNLQQTEPKVLTKCCGN